MTHLGIVAVGFTVLLFSGCGMIPDKVRYLSLFRRRARRSFVWSMGWSVEQNRQIQTEDVLGAVVRNRSWRGGVWRTRGKCRFEI